MIRFEDIGKVERHHPDADLDSLRRAYIYSAKAHNDRVRASGEPYLIHPLSVGAIIGGFEDGRGQGERRLAARRGRRHAGERGRRLQIIRRRCR
jgi:(p)ppGpp synthase/HD superfamily hydrolase